MVELHILQSFNDSEHSVTLKDPLQSIGASEKKNHQSAGR